jgi:hypothetical protein
MTEIIGTNFSYPYRGADRAWVVRARVEGGRLRCEIIDGRYKSSTADFDESQIRRIADIQEILSDLPVGSVGLDNESDVHRGCAWSDRAVQEAAPSLH